MQDTIVDIQLSPCGLTETEEHLVSEIEAWLREIQSSDCDLVRERFSHLCTLGAAVFKYPSIRDRQFLKGIIRDEGHLAESLLAFSSSSHLLHIPTKVVAMRSFLIAKYHAFSLLSYLTNNQEDFHEEIRTVIFSVICTLMTEDVYFSCLEDPGFSHNTKANLADDLIALWDSGVDQRGIRHLTALSSLWLSRKATPPCFGTMDCNSEILRITMDLDEDWREFIVVESGNNETRWALEEFLFGLSWEEIQNIRERLNHCGINAVSHDDICSWLDSPPVYSEADARDLRVYYDFFIERRNACTHRKKTSAPGPLHTLEEIYLKYRIITEH